MSDGWIDARLLSVYVRIFPFFSHVLPDSMDVDEALSSFTSSIWNHGNPDPKHKVKDLKKKK